MPAAWSPLPPFTGICTMSYSSWLRRTFSGFAARRRTPSARHDRWTRIGIECLESRALMAAGALDPTFGAGGKVTADLLAPGAEYGRAVTVWDAGTPTDIRDDKI